MRVLRWNRRVGPAVAAAILGSAGLAGMAADPRPATKSAPGSYESSILPLFQSRCISCHGADHPRTGLDVRTRDNLLEGGHSGPAIVPGAPDKSLLFKLVSTGKMPPGGPRLKPAELKRVADWIRAGAPGKSTGGHWAFRSPIRPALPTIRNPESGIRNPIDSFLLAELQKKGLSFSREAGRRTLIRRVTYDLIGLPPAPAEVDAFLSDRSPGAYDDLVDRLLGDPRYGERWARHWLDPAGYADSEGILQEDLVRTNAWRYRDYVIRSFNEDKPYDRFLREQIAGDELFDYRHAERFTPQLTEALTATGFLRTAVDATRPDFNPHQFTEYQLRMLNDMETILATTVMGVPLQCARCHDHKYEPLSQKDYYRIQACFTGAVRPAGPLLPSRVRQVVAAGTAELKAAREQNAQVDAAVKSIAARQEALLSSYRLKWLSEHLAEVPEADRQPLLAAAQVDAAKRSATQKALVEKYKLNVEIAPDLLAKAYPDFKTEHGDLQKQREAEDHKRVLLTELRALYDQDAKPPDTHLLIRGEWARQGEVVPPGVPALLGERVPFCLPSAGPDAQTTGRRKALASWLTRPDNPLTARVIVNRLWAHHFGVGIVSTVDNLGRSGAAPTNQALLDWLAVELASPSVPRKGAEAQRNSESWSLKHIHRLIVTSAAYRQDSRGRQEGARVDPDDTLLWRQRPRRLEAEAIRDGILAVAGSLDPRMYGEAVTTETHSGGDIVPAGEEKGGRRSIYLLVRRSEPVTVLNTFDAPVMETNCTRRTVSTTATQALALMNSSFISSQATLFARRLLKAHPPGDLVTENEIKQAFRLTFSRTPSMTELAAAVAFVREQVDRYGKMNKESKTATEMALADFCQALLGANEFMYVD